MSMTVRFPNGQAVTYNDAYLVKHFANHSSLYTKSPEDGGTWICNIPYASGAIIEGTRPCRVENPLMDVTGESALKYVLAHAEELANLSNGSHLLVQLKKKLAGFSTRYRRFG